MNGLERFADTTALEGLLRRLTVRYLTLPQERRTTPLDAFFTQWCERPEGQARFVLPADLTDPASFDVGTATDPVAAYAAVERAFVTALDSRLLEVPHITTPRSNAEANADRERLAQLDAFLRDHPDAMPLEGVLAVDNYGEPLSYVVPAFVVFDKELAARIQAEHRQIAEREQRRSDARHARRDGNTERSYTVPDVHHDGALAVASLRAATRLNALYRAARGEDEFDLARLEAEPQGLAGLAARWNRVFKDGSLSGPISQTRLADYANRTEWRLARRLSGAARAELELSAQNANLRDRFDTWTARVDERRAQLRQRMRELAPLDPQRDALAAEHTALDREVLAGRRAFTKLDAFDTMVARTNDARAERRDFARRERAFDVLRDRSALQRRGSRSGDDLRSPIDRARDLRRLLDARREALDGIELPAFQHYVLEAYYREAAHTLADGRDQLDTVTIDAATVPVTFDYAELATATRPSGERTLIGLLSDPRDPQSVERFRQALRLHASLDAIAALTEHPEELSGFTRGARESLETLVAAYRYGTKPLLDALAAAAPGNAQPANGRKPFFANARLAALPHAEVRLDPDTREQARQGAHVGPRIPSVTLCVARTDLEPALAADPDLARCLSPHMTAARLAHVLLAPPAMRAQALANDPALHKPLAILHAKALAEADPQRLSHAIVPPALATHIHAPLERAALPAALRTSGPSELQSRIGIVPLDGEGQLVDQASGTIVALHALVSTSDGQRIFTQRLTPDHRIIAAPDAPRNLAALELRDGIAPTHPIAGLLAVIEAPSGDRSVVPLHGIATTTMGTRTRGDRFAVDPTHALIDAMLDGRRVTLQTNRERFGINLAIEPALQRAVERDVGPAMADPEPMLVDDKVAQAFTQPPRRVATRHDVARPAIVQLTVDGLSTQSGFAEAMDGNQRHRLPLHTLPAEARDAIERGEPYRGLFVVAPQLFTQSLSYHAAARPAVHDDRARAYAHILELDLREALSPRARDLPMHLIPATSYEPIPESAPANLILRNGSFGYYAIEGPDRTTIVEYAPHARPATTLARFSSNNDRSEMDEAVAETPSRQRQADLNEPLALPTAGTFTGDGSRWTMLPAPHAQEGLVALPAHEVEVIGIEDVSRAQRTRFSERDVREQDDSRVVLDTGTAVSRADVARLEPDRRHWQVLHADQDTIYLTEAVAEKGGRVVLALARREFTDAAQARILERGDVLTLGRTSDRYLSGDSFLTFTVHPMASATREAPSLSR